MFKFKYRKEKKKATKAENITIKLPVLVSLDQ